MAVHHRGVITVKRILRSGTEKRMRSLLNPPVVGLNHYQESVLRAS